MQALNAMAWLQRWSGHIRGPRRTNSASRPCYGLLLPSFALAYGSSYLHKSCEVLRHPLFVNFCFIYLYESSDVLIYYSF